MAIVKRNDKGTPLTFVELDGNFTDLDGRTTTNTTNISTNSTNITTLQGNRVTTSSFNAFTSSVVTTSSFNAFTSSVVTTSSFNAFTSSVVTTSSFNAFTASVITTGSSINSKQGITGSLSITGSNFSLLGLQTSSITLTNVLMISSSGQVYVTASSAFGGGTGTVGPGAQNYLAFFSGSTTTISSSIMYQSGSATNKTLYIERNTSAGSWLSLTGSASGFLDLSLRNTSNNGTAGTAIRMGNDTFEISTQLFLAASTVTSFLTSSFYVDAITGSIVLLSREEDILLNVNGSNFKTPSLIVKKSGNIGIGTSTPAYNLDISGSTNVTRIQGSGSANPLFLVQGSQGELFSITDSLSGSLFSVNDISGLPVLEAFSDNTVLIGSYTSPALNTTVKKTIGTGIGTVIYQVPTSSYDGMFIDYSIKSGSIARVGNIMTTWSGSITTLLETSSSIGVATAFTFSSIITGSNFALTGSATTAGWTVKTIIRSI